MFFFPWGALWSQTSENKAQSYLVYDSPGGLPGELDEVYYILCAFNWPVAYWYRGGCLGQSEERKCGLYTEILNIIQSVQDGERYSIDKRWMGLFTFSEQDRLG